MARPSGTPTQDGKRRGCLYWGCLGSCLALVIALVVVVVMATQVHRKVNALTETVSRPVPMATVSVAEGRQAREQMEGLVAALAQKQAGEFSFTAADLNAVIAVSPEAREVQGKAFFSIEGDRLVAQASLPLDQLPGMKGCFLNDARIGLDIRCENGQLVLRATDMTVKGEALPATIMTPLRRINLAEALNRDPRAAAVMCQLASVEVRDGTIRVRTRGAP